MKKLFLSIGLALTLSGFAQAKTPPEVLKPYKQYRAAVKAGDAELARKHAYVAWQKAEELLGASKTTGDLAQNFADLTFKDKDKRREEAFERSIELASFYGNDAVYMSLQRQINLGAYYRQVNQASKMLKASKNAVQFATANGMSNSTFVGEAYTLMADYYARKGNHNKTHETANSALKVFEAASDGVVTAQPILASLYSGFGNEGQDNTMEAALDYQKVMESIDGKLDQDHPLAAQALGRWSYMRSRLYSEGKLEEAEQKGLCKCWPYDKPRNESLKPIERVPPKMPRKAYRSGYSIVEFDLDDAGKVINPEVLTSWPEDIFEKSTLRALEKWQYTARTAEESDSDRQNLLVTLRYKLTDSSGNLIH